MYGEARRYVSAFHWCKGIRDAWFGLGVGGVVAVFLFEIEALGELADDTLWVVVGDLPSAHLGAPRRRRGADSRGGAGQLHHRDEALGPGGPLRLVARRLHFRQRPPTREWADSLEGRLDFLQREGFASGPISTVAK
jgi:hypothetical protein